MAAVARRLLSELETRPSLIKRALSEAVVGCNIAAAEKNIKLATRQTPGNLYVCYSDWNVGGPFIIVGVILFVIHWLVVRRIFLRLGKDRQLLEHSYFRTSKGFWTGLLFLNSYTLITLGIYQYSFIGGLIFNVIIIIPFFWGVVQWLRSDFEKEKIAGEFVEVDVEDYYMDFQNTSIFGVTAASVIQFLLLATIFASLFSGYHTEGPPFCLSNMLFYAMGMTIQFLYLYHHLIWSLLDKENFWANIISKHQECIFVCLTDTDNAKGQWKKVTNREIKFRKYLHYFVNCLVMLWVLVLIPIQIAAAEQLQDIVLNMVALYFITELDDLKRSDYMVVSTNPDRFVRTPGTWRLYTWRRDQKTAAEVRKTIAFVGSRKLRIGSFLASGSDGPLSPLGDEIDLQLSGNELSAEFESFTDGASSPDKSVPLEGETPAERNSQDEPADKNTTRWV